MKTSTKVVATTVSAVAATAVALKVAKICPICEIRKIANSKKLTQKAEGEYANGTCMTPPMGWSSWNLFNKHIHEDLIKEAALALKNSGLVEAGYNYLNIDDCWQVSERDIQGRLQWDKLAFPNGIPSLAEFVNAQGLKLGIYSCNGLYTCENYPGSMRHEAIDADTFASWGIEYFKYDYCHNEVISKKAPQITDVTVSDMNANVIAHYNPSELNLSGRAKLAKKKSLATGEYIYGLDANLGSCSFAVEVPESGKYVLTFGARKESFDEKFMIVTVNGKKQYHMYASKIRTLITGNKENRIQTIVDFEKGINNISMTNPVGSSKDSAAIQYKLMGRELKRATKEYAEKTGTVEKPIVYSICEWGINEPHKWGAEAGNLWRTTHDINAKWSIIMRNYEQNVELYQYSCKGAWNDPDMLEVGNGNLTFAENRAHFALWCMMCAPLILGNDVRLFIKPDGTIDTDNKIYQILTNKELIAINQDELGIQCRRIQSGKADILVKPLANAKVAICVFNKGDNTTEVKVNLDEISNLGFVNLPKRVAYTATDAWDGTKLEQIQEITTSVDKHSATVYIVE